MTEAMTDRPDIDAIEARANAATPGPWKPFHGNRGVVRVEMEGSTRVTEFIAEIFRGGRKTEEECRANAAFVAHARTDILALVAEVRRLTRERDQAIEAERERCAKLAEPSGPRPCDCEVGGCYCQNTGDAASVGWWDAQNAIAAAIRAAR